MHKKTPSKLEEASKCKILLFNLIPSTLASLVVPLVTEHIVESRYLALATLGSRRFFEIAVATDVFDYAFAV